MCLDVHWFHMISFYLWTVRLTKRRANSIGKLSWQIWSKKCQHGALVYSRLFASWLDTHTHHCLVKLLTTLIQNWDSLWCKIHHTYYVLQTLYQQLVCNTVLTSTVHGHGSRSHRSGIWHCFFSISRLQCCKQVCVKQIAQNWKCATESSLTLALCDTRGIMGQMAQIEAGTNSEATEAARFKCFAEQWA